MLLNEEINSMRFYLSAPCASHSCCSEEPLWKNSGLKTGERTLEKVCLDSMGAPALPRTCKLLLASLNATLITIAFIELSSSSFQFAITMSLKASE